MSPIRLWWRKEDRNQGKWNRKGDETFQQSEDLVSNTVLAVIFKPENTKDNLKSFYIDPPLGDKPQSEYWEICILWSNSVHKRIKNGGIVSKIENLYSPFSKYFPAGVRRPTCFSFNFSNLIIELVKTNQINRPGSRNSPRSVKKLDPDSCDRCVSYSGGSRHGRGSHCGVTMVYWGCWHVDTVSLDTNKYPLQAELN